MDIEGIKIDGIPIQDYNGFTSRTSYGIGINEVSVVKPGIYFDGVKITTAEEWNKAIEEFRKREKDYIPKQKIRDKIEELEKEDLEIYDTDSEDLIIAKYEQRAVLDFAQQLLNNKEEK